MPFGYEDVIFSTITEHIQVRRNFRQVLRANGVNVGPHDYAMKHGEHGYGFLVRTGQPLPDKATQEVVKLLKLYGEVAYLYLNGITAFRVNI